MTVDDAASAPSSPRGVSEIEEAISEASNLFVEIINNFVFVVR